VKTPVVLVLRVLHCVLLVMTRRVGVSAAEHDLLMQYLQAPTALDKSCGEIVQQFRVRWRLTPLPEVIRGIHQATPEMPEPYAVRHDTGGQRILRIDNPLSQKVAATPLVGFGHFLTAKNLEKASLYFRSQ